MRIFARFLTAVFDVLFPRADTARLVDETSPESFGTLLSPLLTESGVVALLPYRHPLVRAAIIEAKFHKNPRAILLLADVLRQYIDSLREEVAGFEKPHFVIIPIPLSRTRYRARGYNQVEEVARKTGETVAPQLLRRTRDTKPQTSLARAARLTNMEGAFVAGGPFDPDVTYIVLDDVMTTGATLAAAAAVLKSARVTRIQFLSLGH